ncbi:probable G-protein coupled receptor 132 [Sphaerodactylus townsendi]|uniref:probable G-protein coupled receptor 132 n=1 Tax=Sphaerodactylus townsendi TaxID=933632 RepID=UPI0020271477|nr:probable G-protein coupled receptor 132 [Sphaerodactylus townsendi]
MGVPAYTSSMAENCNSTNISMCNFTCNSKDYPHEESKLLLIAVYSIVSIVGLPANCLTAILTLVQICRGNSLAIYLFGLSLCELMYLSTLPLWIIYVQNNRSWNIGEHSCRVTGYIFFCNVYISILLLCCISVDRYMAVVYPLRSRGLRNQRIAMGVTLVLFVVVAITYSPVFFDRNIQTSNMSTCFESPLNPRLANFNIVRFLVGFIIPFAILIFMNYKIFQSIKISYSLSPHQKSKVKYLAIAIISIFVVCFAPYHFVLLVRAIRFHWHPNEYCDFEKKTYTLSTVFLCLSTANSVADPFIYVLATENTKHEIRQAFRVMGGRFLNNSKTDSNKPDSTQKTPVDPSEVHTEDR